MIKLQYCNEKILVWSAKDVTKLRRDHRIVGCFIGSLPSFTRQNNELGLPLLLMNEEAKLLVDNGIATIVRYEFSANDDVKLSREKLREEFHRQNVEKIKSERIEAIIRKSDQIIAGKMRKYNCVSEENRKELEKQIIDDEIRRASEVSAKCCPTQIYTSCPLEERNAIPVEWSYPETRGDLFRYLVFRDMWRKNYFLTNGFKFGCDFLAYESDPIVCHSKYMIICKSSDEHVSEQHLQLYGRLAKSVRKNILISVIHDIIHCDYNTAANNSNVDYLSIKWCQNQ